MNKKKILDPRQIRFLSYYLDIESKIFSNAYQSAIKAGYSKEYAENITSSLPKWLSENIGDIEKLQKAERNIDKFLDSNKDLKIKADITKFVAERLGKRKYAKDSKVEVTHKGLSALLDKADEEDKKELK